MADGELLAAQLSQLGRDLDTEITRLSRMEEQKTDAEGEYRDLLERYEDAFAKAFLNGEGSVDARKAQARLECVQERLSRDDARLLWQRAEGVVKTQQASIRALHTRIDIGRTLLSREKALMELS